MHFAELIPILQMAIAPMIIVSAVSLLMLSLTNRYGRINDRTRYISHTLPHATGDEHARLAAQIPILYRRARLLRLAVAFAIISAILAAVLIIALFVTAFFQSNFILPAILIFIACMLALIAALVVYLIEVNHSLTAMQFEIFGNYPPDNKPDPKP
jgi:hypothetical protein